MVSRQPAIEGRGRTLFRRIYDFLACRAHSAIMFAALFCTLAVKFFHAWRTDLVGEYLSWIYADIAFLLVAEVILSWICSRWPRKWVLRTATSTAALVCTWSVMNAAWLIRTGTQVLPTVLLSLVRDPLNTLGMVGVNLIRMPAAAAILLLPSGVALAFFFSVLARPRPACYQPRNFCTRMVLSLLVAVVACALRGMAPNRSSEQMASLGLRYNCQLRAVTSFFRADSTRLTRRDLDQVKRTIPAFDELKIERSPTAHAINHNVVIVILEGIQYRYTSLSEPEEDLTPYLAILAEQGVEFANTRSPLTHTTKALFALFTGRYPSVSHDIVEAIPAAKPYASLATILKRELGFRTAFFQSAKGTFEARPGLVFNLGFDTFWARENSNDPNTHIGYLGSDEFAMLRPITEWIKSAKGGFLLAILCSVSHDPYEVPQWFATPAKEAVERYEQAVSYTDRFIAALDGELSKLGLAEKTIFCVIGDHGEAFGEHGQMGHERIGFEEVLRIPFVLRAASLAEPVGKVTRPVSSIDLTPTLLAMLGFEVGGVDFDGIDAMSDVPDDRKVYFSGWIQEGPAGFVKGTHKFVYDAANEKVFVYDLGRDPNELVRTEAPEQEGAGIAQEIIRWRKNSILRPNQERSGKRMLFDCWLCRWNGRSCLSKYCPEATD
jgi:phosphoglycerol transferase MdoB-like AlkP superfamily enzyme